MLCKRTREVHFICFVTCTLKVLLIAIALCVQRWVLEDEGGGTQWPEVGEQSQD